MHSPTNSVNPILLKEMSENDLLDFTTRTSQPATAWAFFLLCSPAMGSPLPLPLLYCAKQDYGAGGKPSTWFPTEALVELHKQAREQASESGSKKTKE